MKIFFFLWFISFPLLVHYRFIGFCLLVVPSHIPSIKKSVDTRSPIKLWKNFDFRYLQWKFWFFIYFLNRGVILYHYWLEIIHFRYFFTYFLNKLFICVVIIFLSDILLCYLSMTIYFSWISFCIFLVIWKIKSFRFDREIR